MPKLVTEITKECGVRGSVFLFIKFLVHQFIVKQSSIKRNCGYQKITNKLEKEKN